MGVVNTRYKDTQEPTPTWKWALKDGSVQVDELNPAIISYLNTLEPEYQELIFATSGNDGTHVHGSTHYSNTGVDLRINNKENPWEDVLFKRIATDPNRIAAGIALIQPQHGTAAHIHLSVGSEKEFNQDVYHMFSDDEFMQTNAPNSFTTIKESSPFMSQAYNDLVNQSNNFTKDFNVIFPEPPEDKEDKLAELKQEVLNRQRQRQFILDVVNNLDVEFVEHKRASNPIMEEGGVVDPELESMSKVLTMRNQNLPWVSRVLNDDSLSISNSDGSVSTHKLAYSTDDSGGAFVYPTIIERDGKLVQLSEEEAWNYAKESNTAMYVPNVKLAEYYSQNGLINPNK